jgi:Tfp pilus assembly protein PilN
VNLLPPEIHEAAKFRRLQLALGACGVAAVAVVGFLGYSAHHSVAAAKEALAQSQARQHSLQARLAGLQSVRDTYTQVAAKEAMLSQAMGNEIRWSYYLSDLSLRIPSNVWLTQITANESTTGAPTTAAAAATSVMPAGIGTVQFSGIAFSHDDVATWLDALAKEKGFTNVYFSSSTKGLIGTRPVVNFASQVTLTSAALSGRYTNAQEG